MGEVYLEWFKRSKRDFDTAKYNFKGKKFDAGLFFLQQYAEKALKAFYIKKFKELVKTHDLVFLSRKLGAPVIIEGYCKELTVMYQYTRYPDVSEISVSKEEIDNYVIFCEEVLQWVKKNM